MASYAPCGLPLFRANGAEMAPMRGGIAWAGMFRGNGGGMGPPERQRHKTSSQAYGLPLFSPEGAKHPGRPTAFPLERQRRETYQPGLKGQVTGFARDKEG